MEDGSGTPVLFLTLCNIVIRFRCHQLIQVCAFGKLVDKGYDGTSHLDKPVACGRIGDKGELRIRDIE